MLDLYLSPKLAGFNSERPETLKLGGEKSERTVLFSDVKGFTSISERLRPEELVELLNLYLGDMTDVVFAHDGMLDKYIGDGLMVVWGAPVPQSDHAGKACAAAVDMLGRLDRLSLQIAARGWPPVKIRIGLNTGAMVFGNMGSAGHLSLTVMGDNVNLASWLEGINKLYDSTIIASESTVAAAGDAVVVRELDHVQVRGRDLAVRIYEVLGPRLDAARWRDLVTDFSTGLAAYRARDWQAAISAFEAVERGRPSDGPSALYLQRCRKFLSAPPPAEWEPVTSFNAA